MAQEEKTFKTVYFDKEDQEEEINFLEIIEKYRYYWKWLIACVIVSITISLIYLAKIPNQYLATSKILIDDKNNGGMTSELSAFQDLGMFGESKSSIDTEIGVLKSRTLFESVAKNLDLNIMYYEIGRFKDIELYSERSPIKLKFIPSDQSLLSTDTSFVLTVINKDKFVLSDIEGNISTQGSFGETISSSFGEFYVSKTDSLAKLSKGEIKIIIRPLKIVANNIRNSVVIQPENKKSSLLELSLEGPNLYKSKDVLNNLIQQYNENAVSYKSYIAQNTDRFINERILDISKELESVDRGVEDFKTKNKLSDIGYEANLVLESNSIVEKEIVKLNSQLQLVEYVQNHIKDNKNDLIPANLGLEDASTNQNTLLYNQLLLERNRIIKNSSKLNPTVINLDSQLQTLRQSIEQSLLNLSSSLKFSLNQARSQESRLNTKKKDAPLQEREFQDIKRKQQIIEALYLYLLEKREENAISLGIPVPNAKIIDVADGSDIPIGPNKKLYLFISGLIGIIVPVLIISIKSLLDNKVHSREDVENLLNVPIMGDIPKSNLKNKYIVTEGTNNGLGEAFRLLRTNVNFMLSNTTSEKGQCIYVTSTVAGEGKSFVSLNLASSLALLNKKVILIGADVRKPKLHQYLNSQNTPGLTNFLTDYGVRVKDVIVYNKDLNCDVIFSGDIPPNPSELLLNGRFDEVLDFVKDHYEFIIIDTAPVSMVTDTLLLGASADLFIYVIRAGFLDKRMLKIPKLMFDNNRLPNMSILLNDLDTGKMGYGYGYGYTEGNQSKWWNKLLKKAAL